MIAITVSSSMSVNSLIWADAEGVSASCRALSVRQGAGAGAGQKAVNRRWHIRPAEKKDPQ